MTLQIDLKRSSMYHEAYEPTKNDWHYEHRSCSSHPEETLQRQDRPIRLASLCIRFSNRINFPVQKALSRYVKLPLKGCYICVFACGFCAFGFCAVTDLYHAAPVLNRDFAFCDPVEAPFSHPL